VQGRLAVDQSRAVGDDWLVPIASGPVGLGLIQIGEIDEGEARLRDALEPLRQIGDWKWVINCLIGLGLVARRRGDVDNMLQVYGECLGLCRDAGDTGNLPLAHEGLAAAATALGDSTRAARLLGAAEAARTAGGESILPVYDELFDATRAAVQNALSVPAFTAAYQDGRRLSTDQAVASLEPLER
jgi:hypothetical protein